MKQSQNPGESWTATNGGCSFWISFIGWELLCSLPLYAGGFLVLKYFTGSEAMALSLVLLLTIPLSIGFFFVRPYEEAAWATFYRDITAAPTEPDEAS